MFNAKKKRIEVLEATVRALKDDVKLYKRDSEELRKAVLYTGEDLKEARRGKEISDYKLGLVEQLMKQLTININLNGKAKK